MMADALLAQSAMDRLQSAAYGLVVEGEDYRQRWKPAITKPADRNPTTIDELPGPKRPSPHGPRPGQPGPNLMANQWFPSPWQTTRPVIR
jgi:hypothetical protein